MRRPGLILAGMLLATGGALAVASPVSADVGTSGADSHRWHCHWVNNHWDDWDDGDDWTARRHDGDRRRFCHRHRHGHGSWHGHGHGNWHGGPIIVTRPR